MREIKYKIWDKEHNRMYRGTVDLYDISAMTMFCSDDRKDSLLKCHGGYLIPLQYTGLHDKNGKEIFEGDIVRLPNNSLNIDEPVISHYIGKIEYDTAQWLIAIEEDIVFQILDELSDLEIIGNIYENPELLEAEYKQSEVK